MRRRQARRIQTRDSVALGGWLFADLMLALGITFLIATSGGTAPRVSVAAETAMPSPAEPMASLGATPSPAQPSFVAGPTASLGMPTQSPGTPAASQALPTLAPATPVPSCVPVVSLDKEVIVAGPGGPNEPPTAAQLQRAFRKYRGRIAGLIQAYGRTSVNDATRGEIYAREALQTLRKAVPDIFGAVTRTESYHNQQAADFGEVSFSVYFVAAECDNRG